MESHLPVMASQATISGASQPWCGTNQPSLVPVAVRHNNSETAATESMESAVIMKSVSGIDGRGRCSCELPTFGVHVFAMGEGPCGQSLRVGDVGVATEFISSCK